VIYTLPVLLAIMDRIGGWRYKWVRRYGIPVVIFTFFPTIETALWMTLLVTVFTFNLDEIEEKRDEEIFLHGLGIAFSVYHLSGIYSMAISLGWFLGVKASLRWNGVRWRYVEAGRGFLIGLSIVLGVV